MFRNARRIVEEFLEESGVTKKHSIFHYFFQWYRSRLQIALQMHFHCNSLSQLFNFENCKSFILSEKDIIFFSFWLANFKLGSLFIHNDPNLLGCIKLSTAIYLCYLKTIKFGINKIFLVLIKNAKPCSINFTEGAWRNKRKDIFPNRGTRTIVLAKSQPKMPVSTSHKYDDNSLDYCK